MNPIHSQNCEKSCSKLAWMETFFVRKMSWHENANARKPNRDWDDNNRWNCIYTDCVRYPCMFHMIPLTSIPFGSNKTNRILQNEHCQLEIGFEWFIFISYTVSWSKYWAIFTFLWLSTLLIGRLQRLFIIPSLFFLSTFCINSSKLV